MDFDDPRMWDPWLAVVEVYYPGLLEHAPVVLTPSGGRHVFYRCDEIEGNLKLAYQADGTIGIETRGQGGQAVLPGSPPGTHKSGGTYRLISGDFARIPRVTPKERQRLLEVARSQDERAPQAGRRPPGHVRFCADLYRDQDRGWEWEWAPPR